MWTLQDAKNKFSAVVDTAMAVHPHAAYTKAKTVGDIGLVSNATGTQEAMYRSTR